jgi:pimeloyl-ACP methyl ester carboxylesterase
MSSAYHQLTVVEVTRETPDAVTIYFEHPENKIIPSKAGQFLTLILPMKGKKERRSYSLSSAPHAPDLRGYGDSDRPARVADYALERLVEDVAGLVAAFGRTKAHVVGHDWGGAIAFQTARARPDVVDKLVVMNGPDPACVLRQLLRPAQLKASWYMFFFQLPFVPERFLSKDGLAPLRSLYRHQPRRRGAYAREEIDAYVAAFARPGALTAALAYYRAAFRSGLKRRRSGEPLVDRRPIERPTLVVWGMDDTALLPGQLDGLPGTVRDLRIVRVPGCSHWIHHDAPEAVLDACVPFLRGT